MPKFCHKPARVAAPISLSSGCTLTRLGRIFVVLRIPRHVFSINKNARAQAPGLKTNLLSLCTSRNKLIQFADYNGDTYETEIHWFEAHGVGKRDWKIKKRIE
jgi:hypothetical protein